MFRRLGLVLEWLVGQPSRTCRELDNEEEWRGSSVVARGRRRRIKGEADDGQQQKRWKSPMKRHVLDSPRNVAPFAPFDANAPAAKPFNVGVAFPFVA